MNALKRVVWPACVMAVLAGSAAAQEAGGRGPVTVEEAERMRSLPPHERQTERERLRERFEAMPPEERQALRRRLREQREGASPEERAAQRQQLRERWRQMSPEERQRLRRDFNEAGRGQPGGHPPRPRPENGGRFPRRP